MKKRKYRLEDIEQLKTKTISPKELAKKYGVSEQSIYRLCEREHIHFYKPVIVIHSPYEDIYVRGKQECAEELHISYASVSNALKGKKVKVLEELGITLSYREKK